MEKQINYFMTRCEATELAEDLKHLHSKGGNWNILQLTKILEEGNKLTIIEE